MPHLELLLAVLSPLAAELPVEPRLDLAAMLHEEDDEDVAQDAEGPRVIGVLERGSGFGLGVTVSGTHMPEADFDELPGGVTTNRVRATISARQPIDDKRRMIYALSHEASFYDFDGANLGGVVDPFDDVFQTSLSASFQTQETEKWSWFLNAFARVGAEAGADFDEAAVYGGGAVVTFPAWEGLSLSVGGFVTTRLEDDPFFFPWFQIDWQVTDKLRIGQEGNGVGIGYLLSERVKTYGNFFFNVRQYRLADDSPLPGGVGRDDMFGFNAGLLYSATDHLRWNFFGGFSFRELTLLDSTGGGVQEELDPAPYFGVAATYSF